MRNFFGQAARKVADAAGTPWAFIGAALIIVVWALTGPAFGFSETWQLVVNTGTTIITFLMVFLIQNAQNRDQVAVQLKLDELLKAVKGARTGFADLETLTEDQLKELQAEFRTLAEKHEDDLPLAEVSRKSKKK